MGDLMNIVFLVGSYYPRFSAVGNCVFQIAKKFSEEGHSVKVIAYNNSPFLQDIEIYKKQNIVRISTLNMRQRLFLKSKIENKEHECFFKKIEYFVKVINALKIIFNPYSIDRSITREYFKHLKNMSDGDVLIPVAMPFESISSALKLKKANNNIRVMPILFDPYVDNLVLNRHSSLMIAKSKFLKKYQDRIFKKSDKVFYTSNWKNQILNNSDYLINSVEIEHPLIVENTATKKDLINKSKISIVYQGELDIKNRPPNFVLKFFLEIRKELIDLRLHFFTFGSAAKYVGDFSEDHKDLLQYYGRVDKNLANSYFADSDISLIIGNKATTAIPSKVFECMSLCKPILYFTHDFGDEIVKILMSYPLSHIVQIGDNSKETLSLTKDWIDRNYMRKLNFTEVEKLFYYATPHYVYDMIKIDNKEGM